METPREIIHKLDRHSLAILIVMILGTLSWLVIGMYDNTKSQVKTQTETQASITIMAAKMEQATANRFTSKDAALHKAETNARLDAISRRVTHLEVVHHGIDKSEQ